MAEHDRHHPVRDREGTGVGEVPAERPVVPDAVVVLGRPVPAELVVEVDDVHRAARCVELGDRAAIDLPEG